ncbi:uncharacterized protein LOC124917698 [Impatiens glandulifera]|uniref:uncharacterized protein LOC124917698 n=1 Tax=Impatiens glandulifera TaxID=253017 RepID=UPI001FB0B53B|nr:uncharacterized protein LOC124917698 [Impatiens glandulifera]
MASSSTRLSFLMFISCSIFFHGVLGELICEELPVNVCAFAVSSSGKRCLLENFETKDGQLDYQCRSSAVVVSTMAEHIETDSCISACGVERKYVGISSDSLMESQFTAKLCSPECYQGCPNIVDLFFNLAAGEGVFLPELCEKQRTNPHRAMLELLSSSAGAIAAVEHASAPTIAPFH